MSFVDSPGPGGQPWRSVLNSAEPQTDGSGCFVGPWGDAVRSAVLAEKQGGQFSDGAAGQVIDLLLELGHEGFQGAADQTEQAAQGASEQQVQAQILGKPMQQDMQQGEFGGGDVAPGYAGVSQLLGPHNEVEVRQVNFGGMDCCCCMRKSPCKGFPCCCCQATSEFEITDPSGNQLLHTYEKSGVWERVCCGPNHSLLLYVTNPEGTPKMPEGKKKKGRSDDEEEEIENMPKLLTMERKGLSNCYCVCCFSLCPCCNDNMAVYEGDVKGSAGSLENAPKMHTMINQPILGGCFTPTIDVEPQQGVGSPLRVKGPLLFGGWSEICCDSTFKVNSGDNEVASIKHMKPDGCCEMCQAFCTPLDRYKVTFDNGLSPHDKANVVLSSMLVDYMFFEMDDGPCYVTGESIKCTFFFCNCCGCLCPCQCTIPLKGGGGDDEGQQEDGGGGDE